MVLRVVLDANILFPAAKSDGALRTLVRLLIERGHECWADACALAEERRNLLAKGAQALHVREIVEALEEKASWGWAARALRARIPPSLSAEVPPCAQAERTTD